MQEWLLLVYKVPPEPTRYRASVWRKLKAAGAVYLQHAVAALPADAANERVLRGLVGDIHAMHGTAYLVRSTPVGDDTGLIDAFNAAREAEYREVLTRCLDFHAELARERQAGKFTYAELEENEADLHKLEAWCVRQLKNPPGRSPKIPPVFLAAAPVGRPSASSAPPGAADSP